MLVLYIPLCLLKTILTLKVQPKDIIRMYNILNVKLLFQGPTAAPIMDHAENIPVAAGKK